MTARRSAPGGTTFGTFRYTSIGAVGSGPCLGRLCTQQHAEQVARLVRSGDNVEVPVKPGTPQPVADVTKRGEILDREADAVEQGDLAGVAAAGRPFRGKPPEIARVNICHHLRE